MIELFFTRYVGTDSLHIMHAPLPNSSKNLHSMANGNCFSGVRNTTATSTVTTTTITIAISKQPATVQKLYAFF